MNNHILDRPVWSALNTTHRRHSIGSNHALRFETDISPFAAVPDESTNSLANLASLIPENEQILLAQADPIVIPENTGASLTTSAYQMIYENGTESLQHHSRIEILSESDCDQMQELAALTKPGPFLNRTHILGDFWGVKENGKLIAMAGERLKQPGFTEISGVCTHPDYQGKGLAGDLCIAVMRSIIERGETPYLHVFTDNTAAVKLYEKLGFKTRVRLYVAMLEKRGFGETCPSDELE